MASVNIAFTFESGFKLSNADGQKLNALITAINGLGLGSLTVTKTVFTGGPSITVAAFTDADATSLAEGSLVLDPTAAAGKVGVVSNGLIQTLST